MKGNFSIYNLQFTIIFLLTLLFPVTCFLYPAFAHSENSIVVMVEGGFEPSEVTVDENSTIIFLNKDTKDRWPASNVHPTHEIYPEFDPKMGVKQGESWSFKGLKKGEWKYHDHLYPHMRGVIKVVAEDFKDDSNKFTDEPENKSNNIIDQIKSILAGLIDKVKTLYTSILNRNLGKVENLPDVNEFKKFSEKEQFDELKKIAGQNDEAGVWDFIKEAFKEEAGSSGNIHDLAHLAGSLIFQKQGFEGIKNCSGEFAFGCYHGFLDEAFKKNLDRLQDAENACFKLASSLTGPVASCIHGIGHGVASFYSTNDLESSLKSCRKLQQGKQYCFDGVLMEFVRSAPQAFFKKVNPLYPCDSLEENYGYAYSYECGRNQPQLLLGRFNMGVDQVIKICLNSKSTPFKNGCFDSLGFIMATFGDVDKIVEGCQSIGISEYIGKCIEAASGELIFQEIQGWDVKSKAVCSSLRDGKDKCLQNLERLIKEYGKTEKNFTKLKGK